MNGTDASPPAPGKPLYARFPRRFRGIVIDWILALALIFGAVALATAVRDDTFSRTAGIVVILALLLYEPLTVAFAGGTIGHYLTNLRVVDDRHGGNVSLPKAIARFVIKSVLGLYSFIVMLATRRNQALHDLLTRSTVQIREPAKASERHYVEERTEGSNPNMPSAWRRLAVIFAYLVPVTVVYILALGVTSVLQILSNACLEADRCAPGERLVMLALGAAWIAAMAVCIGLGWRGKLFGARIIRDRH